MQRGNAERLRWRNRTATPRLLPYLTAPLLPTRSPLAQRPAHLAFER